MSCSDTPPTTTASLSLSEVPASPPVSSGCCDAFAKTEVKQSRMKARQEYLAALEKSKRARGKSRDSTLGDELLEEVFVFIVVFVIFSGCLYVHVCM